MTPPPADSTPSPPATGVPRGRRREADRNDERLLVAAQEAFSEAGWSASMTQIAKRAGVGMGSVYRRYSGKVQLAQHLRITGITRLTVSAEAAGGQEPTGWRALERFMTESVDSHPGSLLPVIGSKLPVTREIEDATARLHSAVRVLVDRARAEGALRPDMGAADLILLLDQLKAKLPASPERARQLRMRYLCLVLDGLRPTGRQAAEPPAALGQPAPEWEELCAMWHAAPGTGDGTGAPNTDETTAPDPLPAKGD